ncbi:alpha/beta fold hydrolase [Paenibacillus pini]|nr:alpha/beta fold hydrolase [Paenibacillus pini]
MTRKTGFKSKSNTLRITAAASLALSLCLPTIAQAATPTQQIRILAEPVRDIATKVGAVVQWNQSLRTVTLVKGNNTLILTIGKAEALFNGKSKDVGGVVRVESGRAYAPSDRLIEWFKENNKTETPYSSDPADLFMKQLQDGNGSKATEYMSPALKKAAPEQAISVMWKQFTQAFGTASTEPIKQENSNSVHRNVTYSFKTDRIPYDLTLRLNAQNEVDDFRIVPASPLAYQKPAYEHTDAYTEKEVTIGEGELALPGTLTTPAGQGPFPAVVLVHGSGPSDRDESVGGAKPLRDLAVGLANKGIAVLRYDKVTYEHTMKVNADPKFNIKKETVDDAISAVNLLTKTQNIDSTRIFVAGHSQGGYAMPLIIDADKQKHIAGTILLAGPSSKFIDVAIEQTNEVMQRVKELGQDPTPYEPLLQTWTSVAKLLNDPQYSVDKLPANFPMPPAYWWYEQKNYKPTDLAKTQTGPMLVLQGENDYQVPIQEYEAWKKELKDRKDVEFKSYPKVTHLLTEYDGISTGAEYAMPANVSPTLIDDIANWVNKNTKK